MAISKETVFSEYEVRKLVAKVGDSDTFVIKCIGSLEEESEVVTISKKCRGVVTKKRTRGTGSGTLKLSAHMPWLAYVKLMGMDADGLADGVYAYGRPSKHPEFCLTADVYDEDDNNKLKAWPKCVMSAGPAIKTENGAEEVAEVEMEIGFMPDEAGFGHYECDPQTATGIKKDTWLNEFTSAAVTTELADDAEPVVTEDGE